MSTETFECCYCGRIFTFDTNKYFNHYDWESADPTCPCGESKQIKHKPKEDKIDIYDNRPLSQRTKTKV